MSFSLGLAIWGYKGWLGGLFPEKAKTQDFLRLYSQRFSCVEGNTTFYAIPSAETVRRWADQVPQTFQFCPKLPKTITHQGTLLPHLKAGLDFFELMQHWGDRLGPLFLQLPPHYGPQQLDDLRQFLRGWTTVTQFPLTVEVRHRDWFRHTHGEALNAVLSEFKIGRVLLDTRPIYANSTAQTSLVAKGEKKPNLPVQPTLTSTISLIRYISHPDWERNQVYLQEWADRIATWLAQGKQVYFFVHCPIEEHSPENARQFQALLEKQGIQIPPLPWNQLEPPPAQLSLF
jgi:uncharacterized protein YecE (DUF72 family)